MNKYSWVTHNFLLKDTERTLYILYYNIIGSLTTPYLSIYLFGGSGDLAQGFTYLRCVFYQGVTYVALKIKIVLLFITYVESSLWNMLSLSLTVPNDYD